MDSRARLSPLVGMVMAALLLAGGSASAEAPSALQARCLNDLNRLGWMLSQKQGKAASACVTAAAAGRTTQLGKAGQTLTAQACLTNDAKGALAKAEQKLLDTDAKRCLAEPLLLPPFGYVGGPTLAAAARAEALSLVADLFGEDLDAALVRTADDRHGAGCQTFVLKQATKVYDAVWKVILAAKKEALRCSLPNRPRSCDQNSVPVVTTSAELEATLSAAIDADGKGQIARAISALAKGAPMQCSGTGSSLAELFPAACIDVPHPAALASCVAQVARARSCRALNGFDGLGASCPPVPGRFPDLESAPSVEFGLVAEGVSVEQILTLRNAGDGELNVGALTVDGADFKLVVGDASTPPFVVGPGEAVPITLRFVPGAGSGGTTLTGVLHVASDDPSEPVRDVFLSGDATLPVAPPESNPVAEARIRAGGVDDQIAAATCGAVEVRMQLGAQALASDSLRVVLVDGTGGETAPAVVGGSQGGGQVIASGIDACALADGVVVPSVVVTRGASQLPPLRGGEGVKNTSSLPPPVVSKLAEATFASFIRVCGTSRPSTTVVITGGGTASVSKALSDSTSEFCLDVPLRPRQLNLLRVSAVDDLAPQPRPQSFAAPVAVHQIDIADVVLVETSARPLSPSETIALAEAGYIDLDDPANYSVSEFTVSFTIGDRLFTATRLVATPITPSPATPTVFFGVPPFVGDIGGGGGGGLPGEASGARGGWTRGSQGGPVILPPPPTEGGCTTGCMQFVSIRTPTGQTIPGVILIDGRIKTLKEFFQVSIAISNTSSAPALDLEQVAARVVLPGGLTAIRAGLGTDLAVLNLEGDVDAASIGSIAPGETGRAQFLIRGDQIGTHTVEVAFDGFVTGAALAEPFPFSGASATTVDVFGPPELAVVLRHPSDPGGPDVTLNEVYPLVVEITNVSNRPALYTSIDLFVGGGARLVDEDDQPLDGSLASRTVGHVMPGQTVTLAYRVKSLIEGDVIACQGIASDNIRLSIDTGPDGADCAVSGTLRSGGVPLPPDLPPIVLGFSPENGAIDVGLSTGALAVLTPRAECLLADEFAHVVTEPVEPGNPSSALKVVRADLVAPGTYRLEELDELGRPVAAVPVDLMIDDLPSGTTSASLRLGLPTPLSQAFLEPGKRYRATLLGGPGGVCSAASSAEMESSFRWVFSTGDECDEGAPTVALREPADGAVGRPVDQTIELEFGASIDPATLATVPGDLGARSFAVLQGGVASGGDVVGGTFVAGTARLDAASRKLVFTPASSLPAETLIHVRLSDELTTVCGTPLATPPGGVALFSFTTAPPDTAPPAAPVVSPVPAATSQLLLQVTGTAEPGALVTVSGGASPATGKAGASGLFSTAVPLVADSTNVLSATARDATGNVSPATTTDAVGAPLEVRQDSTPPTVLSIVPASGAQGIPSSATVTVTFDEAMLPSSLNGSNVFLMNGANAIAGSFAPVGGSGLVFTPSAPLPASTTITVRLRAGGVRDAAGNPLAQEVVSTFTTSGGPPTISGISPPSGLQGATVTAQVLGSNLAGITSVTIDGTGVSVADLGTGSATARNVRFTIGATAALGPRTVTVTTPSGSASGTFSVIDSPTDATIVWIAPTGGDWNAAANWDQGRVPNAGDHVRISTVGPVNFSGTSAVRSLTLLSPLHVSGSLTIGDGSVTPAAVVHVAGDLRVNHAGQVTVRGGLTLNGTATVASLGSLTRLEFAGSQVVDGTGEIVFDSSQAVGVNVARPTESGAVTIGAGITVRGGNGTLGGPGGTLVFLGTVSPDVASRTIALGGEIDNGGQEMSILSGPGAFAFVGGAIRNAVVSGNGRIESSQSDPSGGELEAVVLNAGVRVNHAGQVTVRGGLTLNGTATVASLGALTRLEFAGSQVVDGTGEILFDSSQPVGVNVARPTEDGTVTIGAGITVRGGNGTLGGANGTLVFLGTVSPDVASRTIALGGDIDNGGQEMSIVSGPGTFAFVGGAIRNAVVSGNGRIESSQSDPSGGELEAVVLNAGVRVNHAGQVTVRGGLTLNGTATVASLGSLTRLEFAGSQVVDGTGEILFDSSQPVGVNVARPTEDGTVTIGAGITVRGGNGTLGGPNGTLVFLGTVSPDVASRTIALGGEIDNGGQEMSILSGPGAFAFVGGAIRNAVVSGNGRIESSQSDPSGGELEAVVLNAGVRVNHAGQVTVRGGLTLNGTATVASLGALTRLEFAGSQVVDGTGEILFDSSQPVGVNVARPTEDGTVTIGAGITVRGGNGTLGGPDGTVNLLGTVDADASSRIIALAGFFQNHGTIGARSGGTLRLDTSTSAGGTIHAGVGGLVNAPSGLVLGGSDTLAIDLAGTSTSQFGQVTVTGAATIAGALSVAVDAAFTPSLGQRFRFMTFGSRAGSFGPISGTDLGGGLVLSLDTSDPTDLELVVTTP